MAYYTLADLITMGFRLDTLDGWIAEGLPVDRVDGAELIWGDDLRAWLRRPAGPRAVRAQAESDAESLAAHILDSLSPGKTVSMAELAAILDTSPRSRPLSRAVRLLCDRGDLLRWRGLVRRPT
jgi:hypothetical protein